MKKLLLILLLLPLVSCSDNMGDVKLSEDEKMLLSEEEIMLYDLIMEYRIDKGLEKIPLSKSLTKVAQIHAVDQQNNEIELFGNNTPDSGDNCNAHSWSNNGNWTSCCYTPDHAEAKCMHLKPSEITDYTGNGYEISYWNSAGVTAINALEGWKSSVGHNNVIINKASWEGITWNSIGIGIYKNYSNVWFGAEPDLTN